MSDLNHRIGHIRCAVATLIVANFFCASLAAAQSDRPTSGPIERLTPETRQQAIECGRVGAECAVHRYELCEYGDRYAVRLVTPFSRVAEASFDAEQGRKPLNRMGPATVNRWGIALSVLPAANSRVAATIERVEIQKDGQVVRPTRSTVGPIATEAPDGSVKQLTRGFFVFPARAFEPSSDTTVVLVGSSGEELCRLDRDRLQTLQ